MPNYTYHEESKIVRLVAQEDFHEVIASERGQEFREYRRKWDQAGKFQLETPVPLHVDFEISTYCNFRCPFCPFGIPKDQRPETFDDVSGWLHFDLFRKVIDEGVPLGLRAIDLSYYNEPLLSKDLFKFIEYAHDAGVIDIMFSTNGQLLTPQKVEQLLDSGITRLMVSMDAIKQETYEQVRVGGDYKKVVSNLDHFLQRKKERNLKLPITRVSFVKTSLNESEVDEFIDRWGPTVDYVAVQELVEFDEIKLALTPKNIRSNFSFKCHNPWHRLTFRANGDALPCATLWGQQLPMGNIETTSLQDIWLSNEMREIRQIHKEGRYYDNDVCKKCAESSVVR